MASVHSMPSSLSLFQFTNSLSSESLHRFCPLPLNQNFSMDLLSTMHCTPKTPYTLFSTSTHTNIVSFLSTSEPSHSLGEEIQKIKSIPYDPLVRDSSKGSLVKYSLLLVTDNFSYIGHEFKFRKVCAVKVIDCILEEEARTFEIFSYECTYMSSLKQGVFLLSIIDNSTPLDLLDVELWTDNRINYENVLPQIEVTCAVHAYGVKDKDSPEMWAEIILYLKDNIMPAHCKDPTKRKSFIQQTKNFFLHDDNRLWKYEHKGKLPQPVIVDVDWCSALIAEVHNNVGHQGHDATYKTLSE